MYCRKRESAPFLSLLGRASSLSRNSRVDRQPMALPACISVVRPCFLSPTTSCNKMRKKKMHSSQPFQTSQVSKAQQKQEQEQETSNLNQAILHQGFTPHIQTAVQLNPVCFKAHTSQIKLWGHWGNKKRTITITIAIKIKSKRRNENCKKEMKKKTA